MTDQDPSTHLLLNGAVKNSRSPQISAQSRRVSTVPTYRATLSTETKSYYCAPFRLVSLMAFAVVGVLGCSPPDTPIAVSQVDPRVVQEVDELEGSWDVVSQRGLDSEFPLARFLFGRGSVWPRSEGVYSSGYHYWLDPTVEPHWIDLAQLEDFTIPTPPGEKKPPSDAKKMLGVYSVDADGVLRIHCSRSDHRRPRGIHTKESFDTWYVELRRNSEEYP